MKKLIPFLIASTLPLRVCSQGLHMTAGDSFAYVFDTLPSVETCYAPFYSGVLFQARFSPELFDGSDGIRLELYENSLAESPFATETFTASTTPNATLTLGVQALPGFTDAWRDLQGGVRLSVLRGTVDLDRITVLSEVNGVCYAQVVPVPEPPSWCLILFGAAAGAVGLCRRRRPRRGSLNYRGQLNCSVTP